MKRSPLSVGLLAAALVLALGLSACGRKGDPYLPKDQQNTFPDQYPKSTNPQGGIISGS